jgi:ferredoxin-NADP reductase
MNPHIVRILNIESITHNVKRFTLDKPKGLTFIPGQAAHLSINAPDLKNKKRPFTFTGLNDWDNIEFTIKIYSDHDGVTNELGKMKIWDELLLHDIFGAIRYHGEGTFIAGGAGVTPFIAILRQLQKEGQLGRNKLMFSNNKEEDIILRDEFKNMLGNNFINTLTKEQTTLYDHRFIDRSYLVEKLENLNQYFYLCGPDPMVEAIQQDLLSMGVEPGKVIVEQF